ncbi:MAG TPA: thiamine biosynthesis protein [Candidatus Polarisedimenticolia bacterium]|nr:thiamine biosynthesis protein [Candidatus Polarisedimenticolia bacterium]
MSAQDESRSRTIPRPGAGVQERPEGDGAGDRPAPARAVGLMSGGLDSTLAARVLHEQGLDVVGLYFNTGFCTYDHRRAIARKEEDPRRLRHHALQAGAEAQVEIRVIDVADEYLEMVKHPKHGYGAAANPCIDCRIFMLNKAREVADQEGADIVFTGEVLGQRPMSQHRNALDLIEKETGLKGRLLRPLSAGHLQPTRAERSGAVDRTRLLSIKGRSRREQARIAEELEIEEYPQPSGGCCFLADRGFGRRFHDLIREEETPGRKVTRDEIMLLKVGRHFRLTSRVKAIVGRDEAENNFMERFRAGRWRLAARDHLGPVTLLTGDPGAGEVELSAAITARYCDGRGEEQVVVLAERYDAMTGPGGPPAEGRELTVRPAADETLAPLRIGL